jgi:hypothetical protein
MLPNGFNTVIDFRNISQSKLHIDANTVDGEIPNLAAPADLRLAPAPTAPPPPVRRNTGGEGNMAAERRGRRELHTV